MKNFTSILLIIFISYGSSLKSQSLPIDPQTKLLTFTKVVETPGDKPELYNRAKAWLENTSYGRESYSLITDDPANGKMVITVNATLSQNMKSSYLWWYNYKLTLQFHDNKWKYTMTKFFTHCLSSGGFYTMGSESKNTPIEKSGHFDITDLEKMNNNAKNLNMQVQDVLKNLQEAMTHKYESQPDTW
ncbi:MAG: DUF4468 domain-containing protein [Bacteroidia bacterium]|nr:DUF4468 domain-containing protein [Bacteroidia bacterium]